MKSCDREADEPSGPKLAQILGTVMAGHELLSSSRSFEGQGHINGGSVPTDGSPLALSPQLP